MPAQPMPRDPAAEDAVIALAAAAMKSARRHGTPTRDPITAIFDNRVKRQARRLLVEALLHLYGLSALAERQILGSLSSLDLAHADDHGAIAECWQRIEDAAREESRDAREYVA